jgi:hypothetical protein
MERSIDDIHKKMLKRAKKQGREEEVKLLIEWRMAYTRHLAAKDKEILEQSRNEDSNQPRSIKLLNTLARHEDKPERYIYTETPISDGTDTVQ